MYSDQYILDNRMDLFQNYVYDYLNRKHSCVVEFVFNVRTKYLRVKVDFTHLLDLIHFRELPLIFGRFLTDLEILRDCIKSYKVF